MCWIPVRSWASLVTSVRVAEDGHGSFDLPLPPQGDAVGEDGDVGDGLQADVVLRLARLHHPGDGRVGIDVFEQLPQGAGLVDLQDFRGGPVEVGHPLVLVDGQQPLFQGVQNVHPLKEGGGGKRQAHTPAGCP